MQYLKNKISIRQAMFLFLTLTASPSVRFLPNYAARFAKQAGWLAPIVSLIVLIPMIYVFQSFFNSYKKESFTQIMDDICGKVIGKIISSLYIIWITFLLAVYVRHYAERLVSTVLPNVNILVFIVAMVFSVAIILRSGITVIARMSEIILPIMVVIFISTVVFGFPDIKLSRLTPISHLDFVPVLKASLGVLEIWSYFAFVLILSDVINNKENIKKVCIQASVVISILSILIILMSIGMLGASIVEKMPIPYFAAVKQITIFGTIERVESFVLSLWLFSDFILISVFAFAVMNLTKNMFKLSDIKPLINMYMVFIFILSLYISKSSFELLKLSDVIILPINLTFGYLVPVLVFAIGKVRKKI